VLVVFLIVTYSMAFSNVGTAGCITYLVRVEHACGCVYVFFVRKLWNCRPSTFIVCGNCSNRYVNRKDGEIVK